jgi:mannose-6-phosphate isomerase-like protein (cupin superfamily)
MGMESTVLCRPCGQVFSADTDEAVVRMTLDHARQFHDTVLRESDVRQTIKHQPRDRNASSANALDDGASRRMHPVAAGGGVCLDWGNEKMSVKLGRAESGGEMTVIEAEIQSQDGPPLHVHERENEAYYVLDGEFEFVCGHDTFRGGPGTFVHSPRGIPHRYRNVGATSGRMLFSFTPAGIESFFGELRAQKQLNPEVMTKVAMKHGITIVAKG